LDWQIIAAIRTSIFALSEANIGLHCGFKEQAMNTKGDESPGLP
jgi:hypothetical protein